MRFLVMNQAPTKEGDLCSFDGTKVDCVPLPFTSVDVLYCRVCGNTWPMRIEDNRQRSVDPKDPE